MSRRAPRRVAVQSTAPASLGWSDPWLWLSVLSVVPLILRAVGAPLGEPVAEDFDFLRHWRLLGQHSLLDGGGSGAFWRPVPHQLYYAALGTWILEAPRVVAALHAAGLGLSAALLYRTLRRSWGGPAAACAASFPFITESVRTVIAWPSHGVELCSLLFGVLALHEASRRRMPSCLIALALALLSKELAVTAAILIPCLPGLATPATARDALRVRARWAIATGAVTLAWALLYLYVRRTASLALPHGLESDAATLAVPFVARFQWALGNGLRALLSLPATPTGGEWRFGLALGSIVAMAIAGLAFSAAARARVRAAGAWAVWGIAWFALSSAALTTIFPIWAPNRVLFGSVGLGIAAAAILTHVHPGLPASLVVVRLIAFGLSPGPMRTVTVEPAETGAFMDFSQLSRLQHLMAATRATLRAAHPTLPHDARVGQHHLPRRAEYAFGGDRALQVWYADTSLRWVRFESFARDTALALAAIVEYQPGHDPPMALVDPAAMRGLLRAMRVMASGDLRGTLEALDDAGSRQRDASARVFAATLESKRALCFMGLGEPDRASERADRALALWPESTDARYVLAVVAVERGQFDAAERHLRALLALTPDDRDALALAERVRAGREGARP